MKDHGLVDHAFALQQVGDVAACRAARDVDDLVLGERARRLEALLADHERRRRRPAATRNNKVNNGIADDHERIARAP